MATREWIPWYGLFTQLKLPSFLSDAGVLKREEMNNDVERIKEVLLNKGYLNAQVGLPTVELSDDKKWFIVTYTVMKESRSPSPKSDSAGIRCSKSPSCATG